MMEAVTTDDGAFYDEAYERPGSARAQYSAMLGALDGRDLGDLARDVAEAAKERGIAFGEEPDEAFLVDPVPRLITTEEWRGLEAGLVQRVRALDAFVADAYGERQIVAGRRAARPRHRQRHVLRAGPGRDTSCASGVCIAGLDIVRDREGRFLVLEDNVRTPSGIAYVVAARKLTDRLPRLRRCRPAPWRRRRLRAPRGDAARGRTGRTEPTRSWPC